MLAPLSLFGLFCSRLSSLLSLTRFDSTTLTATTILQTLISNQVIRFSLEEAGRSWKSFISFSFCNNLQPIANDRVGYLDKGVGRLLTTTIETNQPLHKDNMSLRGTQSSAAAAVGGVSPQSEKHTKHNFLYGPALTSSSTNGRKVVTIQSPPQQQQQPQLLHSRRKLSEKSWEEEGEDDDDFVSPPTATTTANNKNEKKSVPKNSEKNDIETPVTVDNTQEKLDISNENVPEGITATKEVGRSGNTVSFAPARR